VLTIVHSAPDLACAGKLKHNCAQSKKMKICFIDTLVIN
jgi:hypothetical protein